MCQSFGYLAFKSVCLHVVLYSPNVESELVSWLIENYIYLCVSVRWLGRKLQAGINLKSRFKCENRHNLESRHKAKFKGLKSTFPAHPKITYEKPAHLRILSHFIFV
jgi:hypothetical protein